MPHGTTVLDQPMGCTNSRSRSQIASPTADHCCEGFAERAATIPLDYPDARPTPRQCQLAADRRTYPQRPEQPRLTPSPRTRPDKSGTPQRAKQTPAPDVLQAYGAVYAVDGRSSH